MGGAPASLKQFSGHLLRILIEQINFRNQTFTACFFLHFPLKSSHYMRVVKSTSGFPSIGYSMVCFRCWVLNFTYSPPCKYDLNIGVRHCRHCPISHFQFPVPKGILLSGPYLWLSPVDIVQVIFMSMIQTHGFLFLPIIERFPTHCRRCVIENKRKKHWSKQAVLANFAKFRLWRTVGCWLECCWDI